MDKRQLGRYGEKQALKYLVNHGYTIIDYNYYSRYGEIDIVASIQGIYVFVEVKTRTSRAYGSAAEAVSPVKQRRMVMTAQDYIQKHKIEDVLARFDVIEVYIENESIKLNHIKNAFEAGI